MPTLSPFAALLLGLALLGAAIARLLRRRRDPLS